jgi:hypothetical protein
MNHIIWMNFRSNGDFSIAFAASMANIPAWSALSGQEACCAIINNYFAQLCSQLHAQTTIYFRGNWGGGGGQSKESGGGICSHSNPSRKLENGTSEVTNGPHSPRSPIDLKKQFSAVVWPVRRENLSMHLATWVGSGTCDWTQLIKWMCITLVSTKRKFKTIITSWESDYKLQQNVWVHWGTAAHMIRDKFFEYFWQGDSNH